MYTLHSTTYIALFFFFVLNMKYFTLYYNKNYVRVLYFTS